MSNIRAGICSLKDPDDDYAYQILKGDVERIRLGLEKLGLMSGSASTTTNELMQMLQSGEVSLISVTVCVDGVEKTMQVVGTTPA